MEFEWDENKNRLNIEKHGIDFIDAAGMINDGHAFIGLSSYENEQRFIATGPIEGRYITVVYTMRCETTRIISARAARKKERLEYEKERQRRENNKG